MPLTLNTSHPLYSNIVAFICVDDDNVVKDLKGDTCTTDAAVVIGTGTHGRHFQTQIVSNNAKGIALTNGHLTKPVANPVGTSMIVINSGNSRASRGSVTNTPNGAVNSIGVYTGDVAGCQTSNNFPVALGTTDVIGTGAHCIAAAWNGTTEYKTWVNGNQEAVVSGNLGNATDTGKTAYIGGANTGGFGGFAADYVYYIHFRKYLTEAELDEIYASLGANNQISLLAPAGGTAPTGTVTIGTIVPSSTGASVPFTYSSSDQTGFEYRLNGGAVVTGTTSPQVLTGLTSSTAYTIEIRAVNASGNGAWSTAANFTTDAPAAQVPQGTVTIGTVTTTQTTASVPYTYSLSDQTGFEYRLNGGSAVTATASPQSLTGLTANTAYTVEIRAINATGAGTWSAVKNFTTAAVPTGTITSQSLSRNNGTASGVVSLSHIDVRLQSTGALAVRKTGVSTNGSSVFTFSDAAITTGSTYIVSWLESGGEFGIAYNVVAS